MSKEPERIYIEKESAKFKELRNQACFCEMSNKELFLYTMSVGFYNKLKIPLKSKEAYFTTLDMKNDHYTYSILYVVALFDTENHEIIGDMAEVYKIAEEYSNGGYTLLLGKIDEAQFGDYIKQIEKEVHDKIEKIISQLNELT